MLCTPLQSTYAASVRNSLPLKKLHMEAKEDSLAEDITGTDLSAYKLSILLHHCVSCVYSVLKRLNYGRTGIVLAWYLNNYFVLEMLNLSFNLILLSHPHSSKACK